MRSHPFRLSPRNGGPGPAATPHAVRVKIISEDEWASDVEAVLDGVEAGEIYRITRDGVEIAEVRAIGSGGRFAGRGQVYGSMGGEGRTPCGGDLAP